MESNPAFNSLVEMGCNPVLIQTSIRQLKTEDLSALLDWISEHSDEQQKWSQWLKENPISNEGNNLNKQSEGLKSIESLINKQLRDQLMSKGNSKNVSQKALLLTGNKSVEGALKWIEQHLYDPDFEEELIVEGQSQTVKLSPQQAKAKLDQLLKKARETKRINEQKQEKQRELNRLKSTKEMQDAKRKGQEAAMRRQVQLDKIQKQKDDQYKRKLVEQMRLQRNAKLGLKDEVGQVQPIQSKKQAPKLSFTQQVQLQCQQAKVGNHAYPQIAKTLFQTVQIYVDNIRKNNGQQKFKKINKENKAFQNRICQAFGGEELLKTLGYEQDEGFLVLKQCTMENLKKASEILERYKNWY